jgi:hypothetical protein
MKYLLLNHMGGFQINCMSFVGLSGPLEYEALFDVPAPYSTTP